MDEVEVRTAVAEVLEVSPDELRENVELQSFDTYDSTAHLSLMVCLSDLCGCQFELAELQNLTTYGDILALVRKASANGRSS